jgi:hypothetical protein
MSAINTNWLDGQLKDLNIKVDLDAFGLTGSTYDKQLQEQRNKVIQEFPANALDCISLDETMKALTDKIASESKKVLTGSGDNLYLIALREQQSSLDIVFASSNCRTKIENLRAKTTALTVTNENIKSELAVLPKSQNEQNIYIILGAVVLLVGVVIILNE